MKSNINEKQDQILFCNIDLSKVNYIFNNRINLMTNIAKTTFLLLIAFLLFLSSSSQNLLPPKLILLNEITKISPKNNQSILYYKCDINLDNKERLALITVQTESWSFISIYSSIDNGNNQYIQYPDYYQNSQRCYYSSMDTCVLNLPEYSTNNNTITIYFSVELSEVKNYTIQVTLQSIFSAAVNHNYKVDFTTFQSGIIEITGEAIKGYEQVVLTMQYSGYQDNGRFKAYAAVDQMPNTYSNRIQSQSVGAFNQILILQPIALNSTYYIILQGEAKTKLDLSIKQFNPSSPSLNVNQTLFYSTYKDISFQSSLPFALNQNNTFSRSYLPIQIDLSSLSGYGTFQIDYCNGLQTFNFQNINGENAEIFIDVDQRQKCIQSIQKNGQLLIQNIVVNVQNVMWYFGFSIGIYEGDYPLQIRIEQEKFGTLLASQSNRTYIIKDEVDDDLVLYFRDISQQMLEFDVVQCQPRLLTKLQKCVIILTSRQNAVNSSQAQFQYFYKFSTKSTHKYSIIITHNLSSSSDSQYLLKLKSETNRQVDLTLLKAQTNIIQQNQYQYYVMNLTKIKKNNNMVIPNGSIALITLVQTNGDCLLFTSLQRQFPNFDMIFEPNSVVDYSWSGSKEYILNQTTEAIYIGVRGNVQSLYTIQANLNTGEDLPSRYIKLVDDNIQSFTLTNKTYGDQVLMMYSSHSIPYNIIFYPQPSCIKYSYSLPIPDVQCQQIPKQFTSKTVYFKVSNGKIKNQYKFSVYVNSGFYILYQSKPILIACQGFCYEIIYAIIKQPTNIIHTGMGFIANVDDLQQTVNNGKLQFTCSETYGYPCTKQINATLLYGGSMQIYYQSLQSDQIQWISKPIEFQYLPKLLYMQIRHYTDINTAIFYSQGLSLKIFYNIFRISENTSNLIEYQYPTEENYMKLSIGNSLRRLHIVQFDSELIKQLNCQENNILCIATISVYPNLDSEYSFDYLNHGIGYYSSNTFQYYISVNNPIRMSQQYSLSYFTHYLDPSSTNITLNVEVRPISSCHPQILIVKNGSDSHFGYNPYYGNYTFKVDNNNSSQIQFAVMVDTSCQFYVWLNDHNLDSIVQNIWTEVVSNNLGEIFFVFGNQYYWENQAFTIKFKSNLSSIALKTYQKNTRGQIINPTSQNSLKICYNCSQLIYSPDGNNWGTTYLVKAQTKINRSQIVVVKGQGSRITVLQNQKQQIQFTKEIQTVTLQYYSNNDFLLYIASNDGTQRVTVRQLYDQTGSYLLDEYITQNSSPWFKVRCIDRNIKLYLIQIQNIVLKQNQSSRNLQQTNDAAIYPKVTLHIQQIGTIGLNKLYDGIALFDAFVQEDGLNCYQYTTPLIVGYDIITLDLIFDSSLKNVPNLTYKSSIQSGLLLSNFTRISNSYRLNSPFKPNQTYEFCFSILNQPGIQFTSQQYYLLIQVPSIKHLLIQDSITQASPSQYDVYEYIAIKPQTLLVQVVNCQQKSTVLGSNNYSDILTGRLTQLHSYWSNNATMVAQDNIEQGYYYFGLKPANLNSKYQIKLYSLKNRSKLFYDKFKLNDNKISKAYIKQQADSKFLTVQMPKLQYPSNLNLKSLTYNLYIDDLISSNAPYSSNVLVKCPALSQQQLKNYSIVYTFNSKQQTSSQSNTPTLNIPFEEIPYIFNLTGSVSAISNQNQIVYTYYYDSTTFKLADQDSFDGNNQFIIIILIVLIIGGSIFACIAFRRWKLNKKRTQIAFQMANYNHNEGVEQNDTTKQKETSTIQSNRRPLNQKLEYSQFVEEISQSKKKQNSSKKAINNDVGYGQFVDQTM